MCQIIEGVKLVKSHLLMRLLAHPAVYTIYRSIKKLFLYAIFQKFFHIFIIHLWSMIYVLQHVLLNAYAILFL